MAKAISSTSVPHSISYIYEFLLDGRNNTLWRPNVVDIKMIPIESSTSNLIGVGTVFEQGIGIPNGMRISADYKIIECLENQKIVFQVLTGPYLAKGSFIVEEEENGTKVTFVMEADLNQVNSSSHVKNEEQLSAHLQKVVDAIHNLK